MDDTDAHPSKKRKISESPVLAADSPSIAVTNDNNRPALFETQDSHPDIDISSEDSLLNTIHTVHQEPSSTIASPGNGLETQAEAGIQESDSIHKDVAEMSNDGIASSLRQAQQDTEVSTTSIAQDHLEASIGPVLGGQMDSATNNLVASHNLDNSILPEQNNTEIRTKSEHYDNGASTTTQEHGTPTLATSEAIEAVTESSPTSNRSVTRLEIEHERAVDNEPVVFNEQEDDPMDKRDQVAQVNEGDKEAINPVHPLATTVASDADDETSSDSDDVTSESDDADQGSPHLQHEEAPDNTESDDDSSDHISLNSQSETESAHGMTIAELSRKLMEADAREDNEDRGSGKKDIERSKKPAPIVKPNVTITEDMEKKWLGTVQEIVQQHTVLIGTEGVPRDNDGVLAEGSVVCLQDGKVIGSIDDTFSRTLQPIYTVEFNDLKDITASGVAIGVKIFYYVAHAKFVFENILRQNKAYDASNDNDESDGAFEFSDDEKEREYYRQSRGKGRRGRGSGVRQDHPRPEYSSHRNQPNVNEQHDGYTPLPRPSDMNHHPMPPRPYQSGQQVAETQQHGQSSRSYGERGRGRGFRGEYGHGQGRGRGRAQGHVTGRGGYRGHSVGPNFMPNQAQPTNFQEQKSMHNPTPSAIGVGHMSETSYGQSSSNPWANQASMSSTMLPGQTQYWNSTPQYGTTPTPNYATAYQLQQQQAFANTHYSAPVQYPTAQSQSAAYPATTTQATTTYGVPQSQSQTQHPFSGQTFASYQQQHASSNYSNTHTTSYSQPYLATTNQQYQHNNYRSNPDFGRRGRGNHGGAYRSGGGRHRRSGSPPSSGPPEAR